MSPLQCADPRPVCPTQLSHSSFAQGKAHCFLPVSVCRLSESGDPQTGTAGRQILLNSLYPLFLYLFLGYFLYSLKAFLAEMADVKRYLLS